MDKTTLFHCLIKKMTMGDRTSPLSFLAILLVLVVLNWFITFLDFCVSVQGWLQTCVAFISKARRACASGGSSSSLQLNENADDDDDGELLPRGDLGMVMEKLGFRCDPDEELGSSQFAMLFEEEPSIGEVKEAFQVFDENRDGYIDAGELNKVLRTLGFVQASDLECEKMIRAFDDNGDGRIDFDEFTKLLENSFC